MSDYFGKGCKYLTGQWEDEAVDEKAEEHGPPVINHCKHPEQKEDVEGNCNPSDCPKMKGKSDMADEMENKVTMLESGGAEITVFVNKTIQPKQYEPLVTGMSIKKRVPYSDPEELDKEMFNMHGDLMDTIDAALDNYLNGSGDGDEDIPF